MASNDKNDVKIPKLLLAIILIVVVLIIIGLTIGLIVLGVQNSELSNSSTKQIITTTPSTEVTKTSSIEPSKITTTTKITTVANKCKNFGKWDVNQKKCSCFPSTYGDYCENDVECSKLNKDPEECKLTNENSPSLDYLKVYCPQKYRCSV